MKVVIQRVKCAQVEVDKKIVGKINEGFLILLGIAPDDTKEKVDNMVNKITKLRIFEDENEKMNLSIKDVNGSLLIVSQFTLYADTSSGNRPSFTNAAKPEFADKLYQSFKQKCKKCGLEVQSGIFGANMKVELVNDGPVTIVMEH